MSYVGMCVGGPLDGTMRSWNTKQFKVPVMNPDASDLPGSLGADQGTITPEVVTYVHSKWRVPNVAPNETYDLWVPSDCTIAWAVEQLHLVYRANLGLGKKPSHD